MANDRLEAIQSYRVCTTIWWGGSPRNRFFFWPASPMGHSDISAVVGVYGSGTCHLPSSQRRSIQNPSSHCYRQHGAAAYVYLLDLCRLGLGTVECSWGWVGSTRRRSSGCDVNAWVFHSCR